MNNLTHDIAWRQRVAINRAHADALVENKLLRAALEERQCATPRIHLTPAEIRLRAFDQVRAAYRIADGFRIASPPRYAQEWSTVAECFIQAAANLDAPLGETELQFIHHG